MSAARPPDLKTVLGRGGPIDPARAVSVVCQIAAALDEAHANESVHRDITPGTILLPDDGHAYLAEVGGATAYRAPELFGNNEVTYRADIYALTGVLYECLTGSAPDPGAPIPPPSERRPGLPTGFDDVIARGLARNPGARYRTASELADAAQAALRPVLDARDSTPSTRPTTPDRTVELSVPFAGSPTVSYPHSQPVPRPAPPYAKPKLRSRRHIAPLAAAIAIVGVVIAGIIAIPHLTRHTASRPPAPVKHTYSSAPTLLPFSDVEFPAGIAADGSGNVYVLSTLVSENDGGIDRLRRVLKLAPGAKSATTANFPDADMTLANGLAADAAGNVYLSDGKMVWVLAPGAANPLKLPFRGFASIDAIAVDPRGTVYAAGSLPSGEKFGVKKLALGAANATDLPFTGLGQPAGLAADNAGSVYVSSEHSGSGSGPGRVLRLAPGATSASEVHLVGLKYDVRVAVDSAGNLFIADSHRRVLELAAGTTDPITLELKSDMLAVDSADNVYGASSVTKNTNDQVVSPGQVFKLAAGK